MRWTPADGAVSVFEEKAPGKEGKERRRKRGEGGFRGRTKKNSSLSLTHRKSLFLKKKTK